MEQIALIWGTVFVYWSSILQALAAAAAICMYVVLILRDEQSNTVAVSVPLSLAFSLVLARLVHWYCRADQYISLTKAMTEYHAGGFALMGVFAGCVLAAALLRLIGLTKNLPGMLDCMSIAGCFGIAVGRLACLFNGEDRGMIVTELKTLPWAWPVVNPVSGAEEIRLATFFLQAVVAAGLFVLLLGFWLLSTRRGKSRSGDVCLVFLLCYGATQIILDSTRYDSLYFRSNGFVSIVQVLGACAIVLTAVLFSVRLVRQKGWKRWYLILWIVLAGFIGLAGYMEYFVQRWSRKIVFGYSVMSAALLCIVLLILLIRYLAGRPQKVKPKYWEQ